MMYRLFHLSKRHELVPQLVKFDMLRVYQDQDPDLPTISTWTELITYYLFTNPLPVKDFSPDVCVINFVSLLKIT